MIGSQYRYIAVKLRTGWAVWDLAIGQMVPDKLRALDDKTAELWAHAVAERYNNGDKVPL